MERVAVLGTGIMGAMARNLLRAGNDVTVWNRTERKAQPLEDEGAHVASTPADAVRDAQVVFTMLADAPPVEETVIATGGLDAMPVGSLWIQSSTVGVAATERLAELAAERDVMFVVVEQPLCVQPRGNFDRAFELGHGEDMSAVDYVSATGSGARS